MYSYTRQEYSISFFFFTFEDKQKMLVLVFGLLLAATIGHATKVQCIANCTVDGFKGGGRFVDKLSPSLIHFIQYLQVYFLHPLRIVTKSELPEEILKQGRNAS